VKNSNNTKVSLQSRIVLGGFQPANDSHYFGIGLFFYQHSGRQAKNCDVTDRNKKTLAQDLSRPNFTAMSDYDKGLAQYL
jgi:hypothetical protein